MSVKFLSALGATPGLGMEVDTLAIQNIYHLPPVATSPLARRVRTGAAARPSAAVPCGVAFHWKPPTGSAGRTGRDSFLFRMAIY